MTRLLIRSSVKTFLTVRISSNSHKPKALRLAVRKGKERSVPCELFRERCRKDVGE
tara:strand:+ start:685 stop:852 length:168 start_codon:yes stop_codon:yes gene_type:complete